LRRHVFFAMTVWMVWPPSLSRDRKWPRRTKCTQSRVVGFRLEGNLVVFVFVPNMWRILLKLIKLLNMQCCLVI